jgi:hypothetical protein
MQLRDLLHDEPLLDALDRALVIDVHDAGRGAECDGGEAGAGQKSGGHAFQDGASGVEVPDHANSPPIQVCTGV